MHGRVTVIHGSQQSHIVPTLHYKLTVNSTAASDIDMLLYHALSHETVRCAVGGRQQYFRITVPETNLKQPTISLKVVNRCTIEHRIKLGRIRLIQTAIHKLMIVTT